MRRRSRAFTVRCPSRGCCRRSRRTFWFEELAITHTERDETILAGAVVDQAALYGLVSRLRDLGLALISVNASEVDGETAESASQ